MAKAGEGAPVYPAESGDPGDSTEGDPAPKFTVSVIGDTLVA